MYMMEHLQQVIPTRHMPHEPVSWEHETTCSAWKVAMAMMGVFAPDGWGEGLGAVLRTLPGVDGRKTSSEISLGIGIMPVDRGGVVGAEASLMGAKVALTGGVSPDRVALTAATGGLPGVGTGFEPLPFFYYFYLF